MLLMLLMLLRNNLSSIKLDQHRSIRLQLLNRNRETKIVEKQKLQLEVVELSKRKTTNLFYELGTEDRGY
jgi:hypothetical protein